MEFRQIHTHTHISHGCFLSLRHSGASRQTGDSIECTMPAALHASTEAVALCVEFEKLPCQSPLLSTTYTYEKNPTISFIKPTKSYLRSVSRM